MTKQKDTYHIIPTNVSFRLCYRILEDGLFSDIYETYKEAKVEIERRNEMKAEVSE